MTGLPDEDLVIERMDALLNRQNWALLMVNVAGLDEFADRYGFVARDDVLRALALVLSNSTAEGQTDAAAAPGLEQDDQHQENTNENVENG